MTYSKKDFANDLEKQLNQGYCPKNIGNWAHKMYLQYCGKIGNELEEIIIDLFVLEEGSEFELPEASLRELVQKLKNQS